MMRQALATDRITPNGPPTQLIANADFGIIYRRGTFVGPQPAACVGDCNSDGAVTVDELVVMVNISLETADVSSCRAGDVSGGNPSGPDGQITVDELIRAVNNALNGCPPV